MTDIAAPQLELPDWLPALMAISPQAFTAARIGEIAESHARNKAVKAALLAAYDRHDAVMAKFSEVTATLAAMTREVRALNNMSPAELAAEIAARATRLSLLDQLASAAGKT